MRHILPLIVVIFLAASLALATDSVPGKTSQPTEPPTSTFKEKVEFWGSVASCILVFLGGTIAMVWLVKMIVNWSGAGKAHKEMAGKLNQYLEAIEKDLGNPEQVLTQAREFTKTIREQLKCGHSVALRVDKCLRQTVPDIFEWLHSEKRVTDEIYHKVVEIGSSEYIKDSSKKVLNNIGGEILTESGVKEYIDSGCEELEQQMEKELEVKEDVSLLDIEEKAFAALGEKIKNDTSFHRSLDNYIYRNPNISSKVIIYIGSLYLRDYFVDNHSEFKEMEII